MIKAITFDLWNTLFENISYTDERLNILYTSLTKVKQNIHFSTVKELYIQYFRFINPNFKIIKQHHIYTKDRVVHLLKDLEIKISKLELNRIVNEIESVMLKNPPALKPGVKDTVVNLSQHYKLGIISDTGITPGRIIRKVLEQYYILKLFQTTIFSDEIGYYKPHITAFKTALDNLGCKPEEAIHIGDLLETDVKGAKNYKMCSVWIRTKSQKVVNDIQPDYEIDDISEIKEIVKGIV